MRVTWIMAWMCWVGSVFIKDNGVLMICGCIFMSAHWIIREIRNGNSRTN